MELKRNEQGSAKGMTWITLLKSQVCIKQKEYVRGEEQQQFLLAAQSSL